MTTDETLPPEPGPDASIADIQADIDTTRKELGETVEALAAKADVKARAKQKAADTKDRFTYAITDATGSVKPVVPIAALVVAAVVVIGLAARRRHQ